MPNNQKAGQDGRKWDVPDSRKTRLSVWELKAQSVWLVFKYPGTREMLAAEQDLPAAGGSAGFWKIQGKVDQMSSYQGKDHGSEFLDPGSLMFCQNHQCKEFLPCVAVHTWIGIWTQFGPGAKQNQLYFGSQHCFDFFRNTFRKIDWKTNHLDHTNDWKTNHFDQIFRKGASPYNWDKPIIVPWFLPHNKIKWNTRVLDICEHCQGQS